MIRKILKLQNVGLLQNATQNGAVDLGQVTAIYADNGRGKTTLAAVLRACKLGDAGRLHARKTIDSASDPEVELLLRTGSHVEFTKNGWTTTLPDIVIFDAEFVEQNVYSGFEVRADQRQSLLEFALGSQAVQLKQRIDQLSQDIESQTRKRTLADRTLAGFAPPYNVATFIALSPVPDVQQQIDTLRKRIEAAKNAQTLAARKDPSEILPVQFDVTAVFAVLKTQIQDVVKMAEAMVRAHFAKHLSEDFEDWVSRGQEFLSGADCPFCGQAVGGVSLIEAYSSYFNKAYCDLKRSVTELELQVEEGLADAKIETAVSTAATNAARIEAWKDLLNVTAPVLDGSTLGAKLGEVREQLEWLARSKEKAPLESLGSQSDADNAVAAIAAINQVITTYNAAVKPIAVQIADYKKHLGTENIAALQAEIQKLEAAQKRLLPDVMTAVSEYQAAEAERRRLDGEKTSARQQLDTLMQTALRQYQVGINDILTRLGAEFSIEELKPTYLGGGEPRSEYGLRVRNRSVRLGSRSDIASEHSFGTTLSEADKRTLAFAFFYARLKTDPALSGKLVVLDDPVSSLDRNRRHQSIHLITSLVGDCKQLLVLSHDAYFVREFRDKLGDRTPPIQPQVLTIKRVHQGYSAFAPCDIDDVCSSDYFRNHQLVADYVDGKSIVSPRDVAKAIRPMLEGYYHRRFPGRIPHKLMFGQIIALAAQAPAGNPLEYLKPMLTEMAEVNAYAGQFQHDTNQSCETAAVVDAELLGFANRALKLIYQNG
jgi:wobble nucleotide-excising tRNase